MAETYDITYDGVSVGNAQMEKQGLYYSFSCRCRLPDAGLYRVHVITAQCRQDLGICVPFGNEFGMDKKLSAKLLGDGIPSFELLPKDWQPPAAIEEPTDEEPSEIAEEEPVEAAAEEFLKTAEQFIPVLEDEPFELLDKLENAHMEIRNDTPGIIIKPETET